MKNKKLTAITSIIFVIMIAVYLFANSSLPSSVTEITGTDTANFQGSDYFQKPINWVAFDLNKVPEIKLMEFNKGQKLFDARHDNSWAFLDFNYMTEIRLINLKKQAVQTFSFPDEKPAYVVDWIWIGDDMLMHYYTAGGHVAGGSLYADTPRDDHYYFLNPDTGKFTAIAVDAQTSQYTAHGYNVSFSKESDTSKNFAINYCEVRDDYSGGCRRYGFSVSNGKEIKYLFDLKGSFNWGWKDGKFFISQDSKTYIVDFSMIDW